MIRWTLDDAINFVNELLLITLPCGYHVGITGSVMRDSSSENDLDLLIYPLDSTRHNSLAVAQLRDALTAWGMRLRHNTEFVHEQWRKQGSRDEKKIEVWRAPRERWNGKRVDLFFVS